MITSPLVIECEIFTSIMGGYHTKFEDFTIMMIRRLAFSDFFAKWTRE